MGSWKLKEAKNFLKDKSNKMVIKSSKILAQNQK